MGQWFRHGNWNNIMRFTGGELIQEVSYRHSQIKAELKLCGYINNFRKLFFKANKDVLKNFEINAAKYNILNLIDIHKLNIDLIPDGWIIINTEDKDLLKAFVLTLNDTIPIESDILEEIFNTLHIKKIVDMSAFLEEKFKLIKSEKFSQALSETIASKEDEALWQLACRCEQEQYLQHAIDCYQSFLPASSYYSNANVAIHNIILEMLNAVDRGELSLTENEHYKYKQELFSCLNNLSEEERKDYQSTIDNLFAELGGMNFQIPIKNVASDNPTLLEAASLLKSVIEENALLQKELNALKAQLALKNQGIFASSSNANHEESQVLKI